MQASVDRDGLPPGWQYIVVVKWCMYLDVIRWDGQRRRTAHALSDEALAHKSQMRCQSLLVLMQVGNRYMVDEVAHGEG